MLPKVSVIGAGNVGATVAQQLVFAEAADVVLVDIVEETAAGQGARPEQNGALLGYDANITGTNDWTTARARRGRSSPPACRASRA